jgi:hypothetical protein
MGAPAPQAGPGASPSRSPAVWSAALPGVGVRLVTERSASG